MSVALELRSDLQRPEIPNDNQTIDLLGDARCWQAILLEMPMTWLAIAM